MKEADKAIQAVKDAGVSLNKKDYQSFMQEVFDEVVQLLDAAGMFIEDDDE